MQRRQEQHRRRDQRGARQLAGIRPGDAKGLRDRV